MPDRNVGRIYRGGISRLAPPADKGRTMLSGTKRGPIHFAVAGLAVTLSMSETLGREILPDEPRGAAGGSRAAGEWT
jgi:hypothetical protein